MKCLGIETTAHTFGVAVLDEKKILSNIRDVYTTETGGMIPFKLGEHHLNCCDKVLNNALSQAGVEMQDIELVSFSQGPGQGHALRVGAMMARALSLKYNIPIIGVNHCVAHLSIGLMQTGAKDPVLLYASGANTQIIAYEAEKYRIFGETLDIGIGNFLDSLARSLGLGFPGGPKIYELSLKGKKLLDVPYLVKGMDLNFGGLLTNLKQKFKQGESKEDIAYTAQEIAYAMLLEVSERAMAHCGKSELLLGGGVACNKRLQEMSIKMCDERGARCFILENQFNIDNAAMIAWQGILEYRAGKRQKIEDTKILPYWRTDEVIVNWR
ncbi:N(6)-L-threonylcarbamoyladenine synthase Kae1 [Candidatus Woesearchaeota archaeon]|nr:N(6)-L-threonylcarbamoyladenine synthase Kae1 [Candidatus Woesearchaeota archaeon]